MAQPTSAAFTVAAQTISVLVSGQPDVKNRFGPGHIRPDTVRLSYRGQHIDARVDGRWVRETGELTEERLDQHYTVREAADIVAWPDWLCALATLLRPAAVSAPVQPTARAAPWLDAAAECNKAGGAYAEREDDSAAGAAFALVETFLRKAGEAEYVATPCTPMVPCEDGGEPCSTHERLMSHVDGDHELCEPGCGEPWTRRIASQEQPIAETPKADDPEKTVREHVTTLHLIGEQLAQVESWMWSHLADVRQARQDGAQR